jgi:hypothetical protein|nr:pepsin-like aspartic protease [Kofleriaceae bacterium]
MHLARIGAGSLCVLAACTVGDGGPLDPPRPGDSVDGVVDVPLTGDDGYVYTAQLEIAQQAFQVQLDTGSTTLALAGPACPTCSVSPVYMPGASATDDHQMASTTYGDQSSWVGEVFDDDVALGATAAVPVELAAMTEQTDFFQLGNALQGILGLGPDQLLDPDTTSFASELFATGVPSVMSFRMCRDHGDLWLGGTDADAMAAPAVYTPMLPIAPAQPFYAVSIASMGYAGTTLGGAEDFGAMIVDTGTSFSFVPDPIASALASQINASPGYQQLFGSQTIGGASCVTTTATPAQIDASLPMLDVRFPDGAGGTNELDLPATRSYLYDNGGGSWCLDVLSNDGLGVTIMGDTMQMAMTTVFDVANQRIGFAPEAGCGNEHVSADVRRHVEPSHDPRFHPPRRR